MGSGENKIQILIAFFLSLIPVFIWLRFLFFSEGEDKWKIIKAFFAGIIGVVPLLLMQYIWVLKPELNIYDLLLHIVPNIHLGFLLTYLAVGVLEELMKFFMFINLKRINIQIENISDSIKYILIIALGFAFLENIIYFATILKTGNLASLYSVFILRSVFTTAAHMVFSGIIGYYYAIGKFGNPILELDFWIGKKHRLLHWFQKIFRLQKKRTFLIYKVLIALFFSISLHSLFNFFLHLQKINYAILMVLLGFIFIIFLSKKRLSYLVLTEKEKQRPSSIGKAEENVIIELIGMWYNEGKFDEVVEICDRLAARDPDNLLIKMFREKAKDAKKIKRVKKAIKLLFSDEEYDVKTEEQSLFERFKRIKEEEEKLK